MTPTEPVAPVETFGMFDEDAVTAALTRMRESAGLPPIVDEEPVEPDTEPVEGEGEASGLTPAPTPSTDLFTWDDGYKITRDEARRLAEFEQYIIDNPQMRGILDAAARGQSALPAPTPAAPPPVEPTAAPEGVDLDDPTSKFLYDQVLAANARNAELQQKLTEHDERFRHQSDTTTNAFIGRARESFRKQHNLDAHTMDRIHDVASNVINLDGFLSTINPVDGKPQRPNPLTAMDFAYDMVYQAMPETRDRAQAEQLAAIQKQSTKKRKASALATGGANAPRSQPVPSEPAAKREAFVAEIAKQFFPTPPQ